MLPMNMISMFFSLSLPIFRLPFSQFNLDTNAVFCVYLWRNNGVNIKAHVTIYPCNVNRVHSFNINNQTMPIHVENRLNIKPKPFLHPKLLEMWICIHILRLIHGTRWLNVYPISWWLESKHERNSIYVEILSH